MNKYPMSHKIIIPRAWVPASHTDITATFERIRKQQQEAAKPVNVRQIKSRK